MVNYILKLLVTYKIKQGIAFLLKYRTSYIIYAKTLLL